jgi:hypothetical protein
VDRLAGGRLSTEGVDVVGRSHCGAGARTARHRTGGRLAGSRPRDRRRPRTRGRGDADVDGGFVDARLAVHDLDNGAGPIHAAELVRRAFAEFPQPWWIPYAHAAGAELAVVAGLDDPERYLDTAGPEKSWAEAAVLRARGRLTGDRGQLRQAADQFARIGADFEHEHTLRLLG